MGCSVGCDETRDLGRRFTARLDAVDGQNTITDVQQPASAHDHQYIKFLPRDAL